MLSRGHQVLQFHGLPWIILLTSMIVVVLFMICAWRRLNTQLMKTVSRFQRNVDRNWEMLQAEEFNVQQLEGGIKWLEQDQDQINLRNEKLDLERQLKIVKEELEAKNREYLSQFSVEMEDKTIISVLKLQLETFKKQEEEHLMSAHIAEEALAAERKENADLRQKITELNTELAEKMCPVLEPLPPQDCLACEAVRETLEDKQCYEKYLEEEMVKLKDEIKMMEHDNATVIDENASLLNNCEMLLGRVKALQDLCEEKDSDLQQMQAEVEQHVEEIKQMRSAAPEKLMSQKIQEITEKYEKTQRDATTQLETFKKQEEEHLMSAHIAEEALAAERKENADLRQKITELNTELAEKMCPVLEPLPPQDCLSCEAMRETLEDKQCYEKYLEEEMVKLKDEIKMMEHDYATVIDENASLLNNCEMLLGRVEALQDLCEEKDSDLQQMQAEVEQHVEEIKQMRSAAPEKLMSRKIQEITEKYEKTQRDATTQGAARASDRTLALKKKEVTCLNKKPSEVRAKVQGGREPGGKAFSRPCCLQRRPQEKNDVVQKKTTNIMGMESRSRRVDLTYQPERIRLQIELASEKNKVKKLREKIQAMVDDHKELKSKILRLKMQNDSAQQRLHKMSEQCLQKDQALLQKAALVDAERREKELKVRDVLKAHKLKIQSLEAKYQASELSYKAEIASLQKTRNKLLMRCKAVEWEQDNNLEKLQLEAEKCQHLTEKIQSLEEDRDVLEAEKLLQRHGVSALWNGLSTSEMCQQSDRTPHPSAEQEVLQGEAEAPLLGLRALQEGLEKCQPCCSAQVEASEEDLEERMRRLVAPIHQLAEVNSTLMEFNQSGFSHRSSFSDEELLNQSDSEDVPDPSQMEAVLPVDSTPSLSSVTRFDRRSQSLPDLRDALPSQNHPGF